jgi:AcrR family transcriptional regulator
MPIQPSEARERVLYAAERLFAERGYHTVTVKDVAKAAGIHHASLYHHAPGGKAQLFVEVTERALRRHQQAIAEAIGKGGADLRMQLQWIADWLVSQPPMDLIRMVHADLPAIEPVAAARLLRLAYDAILAPIELILQQAQDRGEIAHPNLGNIAGAIFSAVEGLHTLPDEHLAVPRRVMADELIDIFIAGLRPR